MPDNDFDDDEFEDAEVEEKQIADFSEHVDDENHGNFTHKRTYFIYIFIYCLLLFYFY